VYGHLHIDGLELMLFKPVFAKFEQSIRDEFEQAKSDAGPEASSTKLVLTDDPVSVTAPTRAAFSVQGHGPVVIRWAGVASLWAACQGFARLHKRMFEETRAGRSILHTPRGSLAGEGLLYLDLGRQLIGLTGPAENRAVRWTDVPDPDPTVTDEISAWGNVLFIKTLGWIMRHELAHVTLKHDERQAKEGRPNDKYESEADHHATALFTVGLQADQCRALGVKPGEQELRLERRATATGFGLLWVAMLETEIAKTSAQHPPVARRLFTSLDRLGLRDDSIAFEAIAMMIKVLIDPQGPSTSADTSREAFQDALVELQNFMRHFPRS
jgi:hypothetical protein